MFRAFCQTLTAVVQIAAAPAEQGRRAGRRLTSWSRVAGGGWPGAADPGGASRIVQRALRHGARESGSPRQSYIHIGSGATVTLSNDNVREGKYRLSPSSGVVA